MEIANSAIEMKQINKKYRGFTLDIPSLSIPEGFATALIGENGAGKTTLINILAGTRLDYKGELTFFGKWNDKDREQEDVPVREMIGYTGPGNYYLPNWTVQQVEEVTQMLFDKFDREKFESLLEQLQISANTAGGKQKKVSDLSDGNKMKLMLAGVLARETSLLILDEPASPLDPLMRDILCDILRQYLDQGEGKRTVFFSTHNIADMENVTDYAIIMEHGQVMEQGFVEDLKEKYTVVKGELKDADEAAKILYTMSRNTYGFEGVCLSENLDRLAGMDVELERPSLSQICVAVMKANSRIRL
ncbi:MAG: ABC transporter ATP-binding protein [Oscillospiraceae bacterium]|uniref:ABC transporter ATP-binding protein n=1 Tax=Candidatus Pullilachnospira gallistercoris TaxID=2840911 RepID=A0A9D1E8G3_9FIRM|nr:ABC transporter ATP-binding protein [Candidatus Pullilachnospira gallistercoris]